MPIWKQDGLALRELRVFSLLLAERSITRTAHALDSAPSNVSKLLARLRTHFGDPLFVRSGGAMIPTTRALQLADGVARVLAAAESLQPVAQEFDPANSTREFRLLLSDAGMIYFLPPLERFMSTAGAALRLTAVPLDSRDFAGKLESGEADVALGAFARATRDLRRQRLYADSYLSLVRKDHPQLEELRTRAGFLAGRHIVVRGSSTGHVAHAAAADALETQLPADRITLRLPSFAAAVLVVRGTDSIATLPGNVARFVATELQLATFKPPIPMPKVDIGQLWHERFHRDPAHRWLRQAIINLFGNRR